MARRPAVDDSQESLSAERSASLSASSEWEASTSEAEEQPSTSSSFKPDSLEGDASSSSTSLGPETSETSASRGVGMTSQDGSLFDFQSSEDEVVDDEDERADALGAQLGELSIGGGSSQDGAEPASSSFNDSLEAQRQAIRGRRIQGGGPAPRESTPALDLIQGEGSSRKQSKKVTIAAPIKAKKPVKHRKVVRGPNGKPIFIFTEGNKTRVVGAPSWLVEGDHLDDLSEIEWKWSDEEEEDEGGEEGHDVTDDSEP